MHILSDLGNSARDMIMQLVSMITIFMIFWFRKSFVNQYLEGFFFFLFFSVSLKVCWQILSLKYLPGKMLPSPYFFFVKI